MNKRRVLLVLHRFELVAHEGQACQSGSLEFPFTARLQFKHGMRHAEFHFYMGLPIAMQMADGVGNWLVQSVAYEDIGYIFCEGRWPEGQI
jgi:hypothetical protein